MVNNNIDDYIIYHTGFDYGPYAYGIVGKARWAHLSTCHHIKPEPLGEGLMW